MKVKSSLRIFIFYTLGTNVLNLNYNLIIFRVYAKSNPKKTWHFLNWYILKFAHKLSFGYEKKFKNLWIYGVFCHIQLMKVNRSNVQRKLIYMQKNEMMPIEFISYVKCLAYCQTRCTFQSGIESHTHTHSHPHTHTHTQAHSQA